MSRPTPQPFNLPAGLSVGATLAFARAAYALRGPDAEVTLPVVGLLVDVAAEKTEARAAGGLDASTTWTRHTGTPAEFLDSVSGGAWCAPSLFLAAIRLVQRFTPAEKQSSSLADIAAWYPTARPGSLSVGSRDARTATERLQLADAARHFDMAVEAEKAGLARPTMTGEGLV